MEGGGRREHYQRENLKLYKKSRVGIILIARESRKDLITVFTFVTTCTAQHVQRVFHQRHFPHPEVVIRGTVQLIARFHPPRHRSGRRILSPVVLSEMILSPDQAAQLLRALSQYTKVAGSIPHQGVQTSRTTN